MLRVSRKRFHPTPQLRLLHTQIVRTRLSDKTITPLPTARRAQAATGSRSFRKGVREWIDPALASPELVLEARPPAQSPSDVVVDRPVRLVGGAYFEVVRPSAQRAAIWNSAPREPWGAQKKSPGPCGAIARTQGFLELPEGVNFRSRRSYPGIVTKL
jgi:hypothetical protein